jgi:cytosine/adenosine deaminase-related metal-dependent hydrolase
VRARRLAARWLIPIEGDPIDRGAILIGSDGRLQAVGSDAAVPHPHGVPAADLEDAVILPGFINTHTHLELTGFEGRVLEPDFAAWIRQLRQLKTTRTPSEYVEAARQGLAECYAAGITTVADTGDSGAVFGVLAEVDGSGVAYQEVFGPHPDQAEESLAGLRDRVKELRPLAPARVRIGVSPHSPYTVSARLFRLVAEWAKTERLPVAVHVAESSAETQLLLAGDGPFADAWHARGIPLPESLGQTPIEWLGSQGVLSDQCLCIHAVQVRTADIQRLVEANAAVAHCPLSNRAHGHGAAPLAELMNAGVRIGLGTDSVVSVGRLDLLAEARAAAGLASLDAEQLLQLCTLSGARALGIEAETGSLIPGKWADFTVIRLHERGRGVAEQVLGSSPEDILLTYVGGKEVYRSI